MNTPSQASSFVPALMVTVLGFTAGATTGSAQTAGLVSETWGRASGDTPLPQLGLVLELVGAGTSDARLRLSGGIPGHPATILVSAVEPLAPATAPNGATTLVGPAVLTARGTFDGRGAYELPLDGLAELAPGEALYAQGIHAGILDSGNGPLVQLSHGLELRAAEEEAPPLWFDDLLPHLPEARDLAGTQGLAEKLQRMLNSPGDSVRIAVEIEVTVGLGIEIVDAKAGGKLACELTVERTAEGAYEVALGADVAGLAGVGAGTGAEVGAEASSGNGASRFFRFHSAPGAARGILGIVLALRFPELQPGRFVAGSELLGEAAEHVARLQELVRFAAEHADELERFLWEFLDARVELAESDRASALARLASANRAYANAAWYARAACWCQVVACRALVAAADARLTVVRTARVQGERAVELAQAAVAAKRAELLAALEATARVGRVAAAIAQLRGYACDHYAGFEERMTSAAEVEAKLKVPFVDMKNVGAAASSEVEHVFAIRREPASDAGPERITVLETLKLERKASAGLWYGGEVARTRTLERADVFEVGPWENVFVGRTVTIGCDTSVVGAIGAIVAVETGFGRTTSLTLSGALGALEGLLIGTGLSEQIASSEVGFELQDRRQENIDVAFAIDVTGNGGGLEIELEWADQGRRLARSTTVREGLARILEGASRVVDGVTGEVIAVE